MFLILFLLIRSLQCVPAYICSGFLPLLICFLFFLPACVFLFICSCIYVPDYVFPILFMLICSFMLIWSWFLFLLIYYCLPIPAVPSFSLMLLCSQIFFTEMFQIEYSHIQSSSQTFFYFWNAWSFNSKMEMKYEAERNSSRGKKQKKI